MVEQLITSRRYQLETLANINKRYYMSDNEQVEIKPGLSGEILITKADGTTQKLYLRSRNPDEGENPNGRTTSHDNSKKLDR